MPPSFEVPPWGVLSRAKESVTLFFLYAGGRGSFTVEQVVCVGALRILASASGYVR